jgi:hypothetical protein
VDPSIESEIDKIAQEIERLQTDGDPDGRIPDLNAYLRVLTTRLGIALQQDPRRWEPGDRAAHPTENNETSEES